MAQAPRPTMTMEREAIPPDDMMEAARSLGALATTQELTITQERSLFGDIVTAQPIRQRRDLAGMLKKIDIIAAAAGKRFFYRYPVKNRRTRSIDYIEGPTIKATNAVMLLYGNAAVESRTIPMGEGYICYSRFCDWESGTSFTKGQLVPKSATLGGEDEERRAAIAHNVGQSKSQRNVIEAALGEYVHRAFEVAKTSLIERIGRDIERSRRVIVEELAKLAVPGIVGRIEQACARKSSDWLAPDIARIYAELQGILDGMSSVDETWPLPAPPEPKRSDAAGPSPSAGDAPTSGPAAEPVAGAPPSPASDARPPDSPWRVAHDVVGQESIYTRLRALLIVTTRAADIDAIVAENAERISKFGLHRASEWNAAVRDRMAELQP